MTHQPLAPHRSPIADPAALNKPTNLRRRDFLRTIGVVGAVGAVAGGTLLLPRGLSTHSTGSAAAVRPGPSTTGVPAGTVLTTRIGDITVTRAGTVLSDLDIHGNVIIKASNVTVRRCQIRGAAMAPTIGNALITQYWGHTGILIEDCTIRPQSPGPFTNGIQGSGLTVRRCDVSHSVDGINAMGAGNVLVEDCYLHDGAYFTPQQGHSDNQSHSDGAQISGGSSITYRRNVITAFHMSAFMVSQGTSALVNLQLVDNWLDGGAATVNVSVGNYGAFAPTIRGNRFGRSRAGYQILLNGAVSTSGITGNVWDDTGSAVSIVRR